MAKEWRLVSVEKKFFGLFCYFCHIHTRSFLADTDVAHCQIWHICLALIAKKKVMLINNKSRRNCQKHEFSMQLWKSCVAIRFRSCNYWDGIMNEASRLLSIGKDYYPNVEQTVKHNERFKRIGFRECLRIYRADPIKWNIIFRPKIESSSDEMYIHRDFCQS